ncbi:MAG: hypothetical protein H0T48_07985 [Gemmatimonadaceae bacterium]|nr:hypothetical protein [Gemmatimonadaceae bacterium]
MSYRRLAVILVLPLSALRGASAQAAANDSFLTIPAGRFAGATVRIDRGAAAGGSKSARFWRHTGSRSERRVVGWNPSRLPIAVAFRVGRGAGIPAADSAGFWAILEEMEADFGMRLFRPVTLSGDADPEDVIVVALKATGGSDGITLITWTSTGDVYDARVFLRSLQTMQSASVVTHEMMHALGFGHTSAWPSVMNQGGRQITRLGADDVAYARAALQLRARGERSDVWNRLTLAVERDAHPLDNEVLESSCDLFVRTAHCRLRFPEGCTSCLCSAPSAKCGVERSTRPLPGR